MLVLWNDLYSQNRLKDANNVIRLGIDGREIQEGVHTGIGRYLIQVIRLAVEGGIECVVYQNRPTQLQGEIQGAHVKVILNKWTLWWDQITLPRQMLKDGVSVFLSPYYKGPLISPCPVVLTIHDLLFIGYPGCQRPIFDLLMIWVTKMYARCAEAIITDSEYSKSSIVSRLGVSSNKVHAIPLAVPRGFEPQGSRKPKKDFVNISQPYILYVGNFKPHKNLVRLVDAYSQLPSTLRNDVQLVLAGHDDPYRSFLEAYVKNIGLDRHVVFLGPIDEQDLLGLYSDAQMLVLPSLIEGFGLTALEAMACGCPVAASNRASIPEVVGDAALLFDPEDVDSMSQTMARLLTEKDSWEEYRRRGLSRASNFSSEFTTQHVLQLLQAVNDRHGSGKERGALPTDVLGKI